MSEDIIQIILFIGYFIFLTILHEFIHWIVLKMSGYDGKLSALEGKMKYMGIGIRPIGTKENFICAKDSILVRFAPLPIMAALYPLLFLILELPIWYCFLFGFLAAIVGSSMDIKDSIEIYYIWLKKRKKYA